VSSVIQKFVYSYEVLLSLHIESDVIELNWTEQNWHGSVSDELTNKQAVMLHIKHRPTASATTWLRAHTRQPMTNGRSVRQKLNRASSVQLRRSVHIRAYTFCYKTENIAYRETALYKRQDAIQFCIYNVKCFPTFQICLKSSHARK